MPNPCPADISTLGPRQREVLAGLAQGLRTCEIAARMFVSVKTIESHIAQIRERYALPHMHATIVFACRVLPQQEVSA